MTSERMSETLAPYAAFIQEEQIERLRRYLELLMKWNARMNLTAIRGEEEIVRRHFGESLAVAELLRREFGLGGKRLFDLGSGAGFPGAVIAIGCPELEVMLIESQGKKAAFLKELCRVLELKNCSVFSSRAEKLSQKANFVTMRAVDRMKSMVPVAQSLLVPRGTLALMVSREQGSILEGHGFQAVRSLEAGNGVQVLLAVSKDKGEDGGHGGHKET